jgi:hypothetical protein
MKICQDIMNIIANYVIMERNKDKFDDVIEELKQVKHEYYHISDYDTYFEGHSINIKKKNYDIEFSYHPYWTCKKIVKDENDFYVSADMIDNHPRDWDWDWNFSNNLPDYLYQNLDTVDINDIKQVEKNVIEYFNSLI